MSALWEARQFPKADSHFHEALEASTISFQDSIIIQSCSLSPSGLWPLHCAPQMSTEQETPHPHPSYPKKAVKEDGIPECTVQIGKISLLFQLWGTCYAQAVARGPCFQPDKGADILHDVGLSGTWLSHL